MLTACGREAPAWVVGGVLRSLVHWWGGRFGDIQRTMSKLHPQAQAVVDRLSALPEPPPAANVEEAVARVRAAVAARPPSPAPVLAFEDHTLPGALGGQLRVRVYHPGGQGPLPALVYFHGGGFVAGTIESHDSLCRTLSAAIGCVVASVDYRLAPEHPFPVPVLDAYTALSWVHESADEIAVDHMRIAVGGDSAGGNLATVVARQAKERRGPPIAYQVLYYPVTDLSRTDTPSYREFADGYLLTRDEMIWCRDRYLPDPASQRDPSASPLLAKNLIGLPPAYVVTAECDPLRDEGEAYAEALRRAGVPTLLERHPGQLHSFVRMYAEIDAGRAVIERTAALLKPALGLVP